MVFINNYNEFLSQTRLRQGRDFDELSISSGVAVSHLKAIERANTHPFYSRAYYERCVMKYAGALGVDEEIVLERAIPTESQSDAPPETIPDLLMSVRSGLEEEGNSPPPLPAELFASRGPLVPPAPPQPHVVAVKSEANPDIGRTLEPGSAAAAPDVWVAHAETSARNLSSLDEILPPKLDMTPPKAGLGFPVFLLAIGVALAVGVLAWQQLSEDSRSAVTAQQQARVNVSPQEAKLAEQPATAPATADVPVVTDEAEKLRAEVELNLGLWAKNWADRDAASHLSFFDSSFPELGKYAENRRRRIAAAASIELKLSDVVIERRGDGEFVSRFVQSYRSDTFASKDTKELIWKKTASGMKIVSERVLK